MRWRRLGRRLRAVDVLDLFNKTSGLNFIDDNFVWVMEKHFQVSSVAPQIPRLRSPDFLWNLVALAHLKRLSQRKAHTQYCPVPRGRKSGSG
jgi:hypothetical protein